MIRWWESRVTVIAAMVAVTIPLWFVAFPPLIDLLGHMGRYHVQLHLVDNPALQANWDFHWRLIGNLGGDLLMEPLGRLFGVERGASVLAGLILVLMIGGMVRLARAAHGRLPATAWAAFPFAASYPWQYGLVNYWLGVACALHAAAWFWKRPARPLALGIAALLLWVVHIYGWAIFALLIGARAIAGKHPRDWVRAGLPLLPLALPALLMLALSYGQGGNAARTLNWFDFGYKALALSWTLRDQIELFDIGCVGAAILLIYAGLRSKAMTYDLGLMTAAGLLLLAVAILPYQFIGSAYADGRLWPVVLIVALLALRPVAPDGRLARGIAMAAVLIFGVRIAATTIGFRQYDSDFARHLKALERMPRGAKVGVLTEFPCEVPWRRPRLDHLDGLALVRRDVFTNGQWDVPGAQLLVPKGAIGSGYNSDPSQLIMGCETDMRVLLARRIAGFPRDRFDQLWVIGYRPETLPRYPGLTPLFADDRTILYRIDK